ncbi:MAG: ABC transporter permease, partial [Blastocatellia bacterium]|nr:ABC transporter permease [Blastocatellia bacterium]
MLAGGATEVEAYRQTLVELNGSELLARELRRAERQITQESVARGAAHRRSKMITDLWQDLRYGARLLRKNPGFTLIAVFTLALGIGANTAIFSVINGVLLRPLPFPEPERILCVWATDARRGDNRRIVSYPNFADWQAQQTVFERIEAFEETSATLTGAGAPEQLHGANVSAAIFPLLGVQPSLGRQFSEQEAQGAN